MHTLISVSHMSIPYDSNVFRLGYWGMPELVHLRVGNATLAIDIQLRHTQWLSPDIRRYGFTGVCMVGVCSHSCTEIKYICINIRHC